MKFSRAYVVLTASMILAIIYGSLYPFEFVLRPTGPGPLAALLATWADKPGQGDFIANVLLYTPFGFFAALALPSRLVWRLFVVLVAGAGLSIFMELAQYYDPGRVTTATDVYANTIGTALGACFARVSGGSFRWAGQVQFGFHRIAVVLLVAWLGYRLYPFVPTIDLHKYWNTIKPLLHDPALPIKDFFRHTTVWLTVYSLVATLGMGVGPRLLWLILPGFACVVVGAQILIVSGTLSLAQLTGAAGAYLVWLAFAPFKRTYLALNTVMLGLVILMLRLEPFQFGTNPVAFGWIPFRSFMYGSITVNVLSFLEKFFLYGSLIWLLTQAGSKHSVAGAIVAFVLFITSLMQMYLPGRSAEITDGVLAIAIAMIFALMTRVETPSESREHPDCPKTLGARRKQGDRGLARSSTHSVLPHQIVQGRPAHTEKPSRF